MFRGCRLKGIRELKRWGMVRRHLEGWGPESGGGRVGLEWLRLRARCQGDCAFGEVIKLG